MGEHRHNITGAGLAWARIRASTRSGGDESMCKVQRIPHRSAQAEIRTKPFSALSVVHIAHHFLWVAAWIALARLAGARTSRYKSPVISPLLHLPCLLPSSAFRSAYPLISVHDSSCSLRPTKLSFYFVVSLTHSPVLHPTPISTRLARPTAGVLSTQPVSQHVRGGNL